MYRASPTVLSRILFLAPRKAWWVPFWKMLVPISSSFGCNLGNDSRSLETRQLDDGIDDTLVSVCATAGFERDDQPQMPFNCESGLEETANQNAT